MLRDHQDELQSKGILFIGYMFDFLDTRKYPWQRHSGTEKFNQLSLEQREDELSAILRVAAEEAKAKGCDKVLWSNEALYNMPAVVSFIESAWEGSVRVIAYVRRHDNYSVSAYKQWGLKHKIHKGELLSFNEFYQRFPITFYDRLIKWKREHWEFHLFNYQHFENVVLSFLSFIDVELDPEATKVSRNGGETLAFLLYNAIMNSASDEPVSKNPDSINENPENRNEDWFYSKLPTQQDVMAIFERTETDRQRLNALLPDDQRFSNDPPNFRPYTRQDVKHAFTIVFNLFVDKVLANDTKWKVQYKTNASAESMAEKVNRLERQLEDQTTRLTNTIYSMQSINKELVAHNKVLSALVNRSYLFRLMRKLKRLIRKT